MSSVALRGFRERETRESFRITTIPLSEDSDVSAIDFARNIVHDVFLTIEDMCNNLHCDGFFVDVRTEDPMSYEITPNHIDTWFGDDCDFPSDF